MNVRLFIKSKNEGQQQEITLSDPARFVLGRGPSSAVLLDGPGISREHVAVSVEQSKIFVADVSVNGTWINGTRLPQHQKHRIRNGDVVEIPGYEFSFQVDNGGVQGDREGGSLPNQTNEVASIPSASRGPVSAFLDSFTLLDRFMILLALISILLAVYYVLSS